MYPDHVKLVVKQYPLEGNEFSRKAARAALSAAHQGKFWDYHTKLLEQYDRLNEAVIIDIAGEVQLDMEQFEADQRDPAIDALIERDVREARQLGVKATPTIFINGKLLKEGNIAETIDREIVRHGKDS